MTWCTRLMNMFTSRWSSLGHTLCRAGRSTHSMSMRADTCVVLNSASPFFGETALASAGRRHSMHVRA